MAMEDSLRALREFDLNDLSVDNLGTLPMVLKVIIGVLLFAAVLAGGYYFHVEDLRLQFDREVARESTLKQEYEKKAFQVANLEAYRRQMVEMEESFGALISQLPSDTEVPGLLEDITNKGLLNGLNIASINLQPEVSREFYVELPIAIEAAGSYHDLGAFISGMAGLPRIVTLHDFTISGSGDNASDLKLSITAKTYRYKDGDS
ncbi:type 4a pilus biogenesis protein PilO [Chromatocurvus halotolerans]|uniref:Type IV pilus assembly protein PilO n=1 Tax=Chromatocurvus halotolerans TaxID=1132028 RepID=A0A4R2KV96_9GAMM|nr:type 4a pilus biogenesis protein PilO [Chromatocurvus halotolerans]TCO76757.1 type IV pilus assembly protein PilO [Chromatocurvus halotolerans]